MELEEEIRYKELLVKISPAFKFFSLTIEDQEKLLIAQNRDLAVIQFLHSYLLVTIHYTTSTVEYILL